MRPPWESDPCSDHFNARHCGGNCRTLSQTFIRPCWRGELLMRNVSIKQALISKGLSMRLQLSAEDQAFREEMRTFFTTQVPQSIRDAVINQQELTKDQMVESQQTLNAAGLAVPAWPVEWGGRDWTLLQRHIWHEEM